jgi:hypothetical protein
MKYLPAFLFAGFLTVPAYAQNGFYFSPSIGAGASNSSRASFATGIEGIIDANARSPIVSKNVQLGIGYQYKNWRFQSGIHYFQSGYKMDDLTHRAGFNPDITTLIHANTYKVTINQIGIPLQVGYVIPLSKRLTLEPYVGILAAYTFSGNSRLSSSTQDVKSSLSGAALNGYGRFTGWGYAGLQLEYKVNNKISLFGGPSIHYKLVGTGAQYEKNFFNINCNIGVNIKLGKGKRN